jgi:hypothetical protein
MTQPSVSTSKDRATEDEVEPADAIALDPEDFYFDGPYMVFTGAYHLKRGYCCKSDCRHCPYKDG